MRRTQGSVPVSVASKVYGKDQSWVRAGIIKGYLPIGFATRNGKRIESVEEMDSSLGRINYYISPKLLYEHTGFMWKGDDMIETSNRILELKYFCMQYDEWKEIVERIDSGQNFRFDPMIFVKSGGQRSDPTANKAIARDYYRQRIEMVGGLCKSVGGDKTMYLFDSITKDLSYADLLKKYGVLPITSGDLYLMRKKFFKELSGMRG